MNDRELLELAAKAAGVQGRFIESFPEDGAPTYSCGIGNAGRIIPLWNPLANDGDALRLAVKLKISTFFDLVDMEVKAKTDHVGDGSGFECIEPLDHHDESAAIRRAIVRAAAEIGRAMQ